MFSIHGVVFCLQKWLKENRRQEKNEAGTWWHFYILLPSGSKRPEIIFSCLMHLLHFYPISFLKFWTICMFSSRSILRKGISQVNFSVWIISIQLRWIFVMILPSFWEQSDPASLSLFLTLLSNQGKMEQVCKSPHTAQEMRFAGTAWTQTAWITLRKEVMWEKRGEQHCGSSAGMNLQLQWNLRCKYWFTPLECPVWKSGWRMVVPWTRGWRGGQGRAACAVCKECVVTISDRAERQMVIWNV